MKKLFCKKRKKQFLEKYDADQLKMLTVSYKIINNEKNQD